MAKYDPLRQHLATQTQTNLVMNFREIEEVIGSNLPLSALKHRAWWANEQVGSHVQSRSWLDAGYSIENVDFLRRRVTLARTQ